MRRNVLALALAVAALPSSAIAQARDQAEQLMDALVATVNGDIVTASDLRADGQLRLPVLGRVPDTRSLVMAIVERRLVLSEVSHLVPAEPSAEAVQTARRAWVATLPAGSDVATLISRSGRTDEWVQTWFSDEVRISAYLDARFSAGAQPTRDEIAAYFHAHEADYLKAGVVPALEGDVLADVRRRLVTARRDQNIRVWIGELKDRAEITIK